MAIYAANTNEIILSYAIETAPGEVDSGADWKIAEPNDIGDFASNISTVARNPISNDRSPRKGAITDLDASVSFDADLTVDSYRDFSDGFLFAQWKNQIKASPSAVTSSAFTHSAITTALTQNTLVFARDFVASGNNGVHVVNTGSTTTSTVITGGLTTESTPPTGARFNVCGVQGTTADFKIDSEGNITSTSYDFTDTGAADGTPTFYVGQYIHVGEADTSAYSFANAAYSGFARITAIASTKLTLDNQSDAWRAAIGTPDTGTGKTIRIFTGDWIRTVPINDADFLNRTYQFEAEYNNIDDGAGNPVDGWEYIKGCSPNSFTINMPLTDKATVNWGFVGLDSEDMVFTAKTKGGYTDPTDTDAYNTTNDIARIYLKDENGTDIGAYFKDINMTINNNITPEKILGTLGSAVNSVGELNITASTQALFTSAVITSVVRNNTTVKMNWVLSNDDGGLCFDLPAITLGSANKSFPRNETIKVDLDINAFKDNTLGYVMSCTDFPHLPI